ncbi:hypothetical protein UFOVP1382_56 [uncultured Caudovirales phage]|uniref:Uncharacterized protein n=1 Tax=uncultured Caudovirales phage TaxID=2100421 RepID=A0A6J5RXQ8_9CAUD|nr:hypothetical protein UFOVP1382_56 [uncultured Caudovirales phage]
MTSRNAALSLAQDHKEAQDAFDRGDISEREMKAKLAQIASEVEDRDIQREFRTALARQMGESMSALHLLADSLMERETAVAVSLPYQHGKPVQGDQKGFVDAMETIWDRAQRLTRSLDTIMQRTDDFKKEIAKGPQRAIISNVLPALKRDLDKQYGQFAEARDLMWTFSDKYGGPNQKEARKKIIDSDGVPDLWVLEREMALKSQREKPKASLTDMTADDLLKRINNMVGDIPGALTEVGEAAAHLKARVDYVLKRQEVGKSALTGKKWTDEMEHTISRMIDLADRVQNGFFALVGGIARAAAELGSRTSRFNEGSEYLTDLMECEACKGTCGDGEDEDEKDDDTEEVEPDNEGGGAVHEASGDIEAKVLDHVRRAGRRGVSLTDMAASPAFRGVNFGKIDRAAEKLSDRGAVSMSDEGHEGIVLTMAEAAEKWVAWAEDKAGDMVMFVSPTSKSAARKYANDSDVSAIIDDGGTFEFHTVENALSRHFIGSNSKIDAPWFASLPPTDKKNLGVFLKSAPVQESGEAWYSVRAFKGDKDVTDTAEGRDALGGSHPSRRISASLRSMQKVVAEADHKSDIKLRVVRCDRDGKPTESVEEASAAIKIGDEFKDEHGVWVVDGVEGNTPDIWRIWLRGRGKGHAKAIGGAELRRFYTKVGVTESYGPGVPDKTTKIGPDKTRVKHSYLGKGIASEEDGKLKIVWANGDVSFPQKGSAILRDLVMEAAPAGADADLLDAVKKNKTLSVDQLQFWADRLNMSVRSVRSRLDRMVDDGLLVRTPTKKSYLLATATTEAISEAVLAESTISNTDAAIAAMSALNSLKSEKMLRIPRASALIFADALEARLGSPVKAAVLMRAWAEMSGEEAPAAVEGILAKHGLVLAEGTSTFTRIETARIAMYGLLATYAGGFNVPDPMVREFAQNVATYFGPPITKAKLVDWYESNKDTPLGQIDPTAKPSSKPVDPRPNNGEKGAAWESVEEANLNESTYAKADVADIAVQATVKAANSAKLRLHRNYLTAFAQDIADRLGSPVTKASVMGQFADIVMAESATESAIEEGMFDDSFFAINNDVEFVLHVMSNKVEIGMGGEWWSGQIKIGKTILKHPKGNVDPGYAPVTVEVRKSSVNPSGFTFAVSGGFGHDAEFTLTLK